MPDPTPSQPLNQHPVPALDRYILGRDALIIPDLAEATDGLVVPVPPAGVAREVLVNFASSLGCIRLNNDGGADVTDVELVYKDGTGREAIMGTLAGPVSAGASGSVPTDFTFYLTSEDEGGGIFIRYTGAGGGVSVVSTWNDVRNVIRTVTPLFEGVSTLIHPAVPDGNTMYFPNAFGGIQTSGLINYDALENEVLYTLSDGTNTAPLFSPAANPEAAPTPGTIGSVLGATPSCVHIPDGFELRATLQDTPTTPGEIFAYVFTGLANQCPVRQDQGGAY